MTLRLYYDSDALIFDAAVIGHDGDDRCRVVLDRTAFYPTSGGQPHDTGTLGDARVLDVIDGDDHIVHVLDQPLALGPVRGKVDAGRRRDFTVQHTAQHLLSALADDRLGWHTESVHFGERHCTIELDTSNATEQQLTELEERANAAIGEALPVTFGYEDAATATGLRKPPAREGTIRVVTIAGIDRNACGGTHVTSTAQIGSLILTGIERVRGRIRLGFLAGSRVRADRERLQRILASLSEASGTAVDELGDVVPRKFAALRDAEKRVEALERELAGYRMREMLDAVAPGSDGIRRLVLHPAECSPGMLRHLLQAAAAEQMVLCVATDLPDTIAVAASTDTGRNAGAMLKSALQQVGGRGGGSATLAQGVAAEGRLDDIIALLVEE